MTADHLAELNVPDRRGVKAAVRRGDGPFATYAVSSYSPYLALWAARRGLTPNAVTCMSLGAGVAAAAWFAGGDRAGMLTGAVLLYLAFALSRVDGQLARATGASTPLGAWLDAVCGVLRDAVVYAGLAVGSLAAPAGSPVHGGDVWPLATAALALLVVRRTIGVSSATAAVPTGRRGPIMTAALLPDGERIALTCLAAALTNARVTFTALLIWGALATAAALTLNIARPAREATR
ncbi:CDP-alcohol phosphatidyltransferase family protein [Spirillospora sp. CA-294931]|uniref:CDP-alcohol phosphatidyltransferase family protein n=1 Tax=Spirillospora sp. CA-294931 TaxID=3240042 RepID=UPI003D8F3259